MPENSRPIILSLGEMMPGAPEALSPDFEIHTTANASMAEIVAKHGSAIRALTTRGKPAIDAAMMDRLPALELIASFAVGYDSIDVNAAKARGLIVTNTPDVLTDEVADFAVGLLISTVRRFPQSDRYLRDGHWMKAAFPLTASLRDRTVGIAGMGRIGKAIAKRLAAFDLPIEYHGRNRQPDLAYPYRADLVSLAKAVDVLIVVLPGGAATKHAVNADVLAALGANGILINVARGSVVDEAALIAALQNGAIHSAGLDVFEDEPAVPAALIALDNVVLMPHAASGTHFTRGLMADLGVHNIKSWFAGNGPVTPVPETPWVQRTV